MFSSRQRHGGVPTHVGGLEGSGPLPAPELQTYALASVLGAFFFLSGGVTERTREAASHQNPASRRIERRTKEGQGRKRPAQMPRQKSGVLAQAVDQTPLRPPTPP